MVAFTVVPEISCPQDIDVALQTKSLEGAVGAVQERHSIVVVPHDDAVPHDELVL